MFNQERLHRKEERPPHELSQRVSTLKSLPEFLLAFAELIFN